MAQPTPSKTPIPKYRLLGNSSLRVFPLCLGAMHFGEQPFGTARGITTPFEEAEKMLLRYIEAGGNFIDTANFYHFGQSEEWLAKIISKNSIDREKLVIATKYTLPMVHGDPNASGNHKKNLRRSVKDSLKRLQTDYIDLLYVHFWDNTVDIEDLMRQLDEVVKSGQVHHIAASDFPAWVVSSANSIAKIRGWTPFTAYTGMHNIGQRDMEQELFPMCEKLNIAIVPWKVVGAGKFTGTRTRENAQPEEAKRKNVLMTESDFKIQDVVLQIAKEINRTPAQVVINWSMRKTTSPLLGCRTLSQLEDSLGALEFELTEKQMVVLDEAGKDCPELIFPQSFVTKQLPMLPNQGYTVEK